MFPALLALIVIESNAAMLSAAATATRTTRCDYCGRQRGKVGEPCEGCGAIATDKPVRLTSGG